MAFCSKEREREYIKAYREANKEEIAKKARAYYLKNKEILNKKAKEYHSKNKEEINKKVSEYYKKNKETIRNWNIEYQKKKRQDKEYVDEVNRRARENYKKRVEKNKDKALLKWRTASHKRRALVRQAISNVTLEEVNKLIEKSGNICSWCGKDIPKGQMHLDHVYPLSKGGEHTIQNLVVSCASCNHRKSDKDPSEFIEILIQEVLQQPRHSLMSVS